MLWLLFACALVGLDEGTKAGDACDDEGDLRCASGGDLLECADGEWVADAGCGCDASGAPSCG
jgi:hypothetical protein